MNLPFPIRTIPIDSKNTVALPEDSIGVAQNAPPKDCFTFMVTSGVRKVVQSTSKHFEDRLKLASQIIKDPGHFLDEPLSCYFGGADKFTERNWTFRSSSEKSTIINQINQYLPSIKGAKTLGETTCLIIDELFTNALFNAPFGETDYALDRSLMVVLDQEKAGKIFVAHDDKHLFLGCLDRFGTLDCSSLIQRTQINLNSSLGTTINMGPGGAGVGLIRAIEFSSDVFAVVERGKRTFVGCALELFGSTRGAKASPKNFYFENYHVEDTQPPTMTVTRGTSAVIRASQVGTSSIYLDPINLTEIFDASIDMSMVDRIEASDKQQLSRLLTRSPHLKKFHFEYVHFNLLETLRPLLAENRRFEVKSLCVDLKCDSCKSTQVSVLKLQSSPNNSFKIEENCVSCAQPITRTVVVELPT